MSSMSQFLPLSSQLRLLREHTPDPRYRRRARSRLLFSAMIEPLRWAEWLRYARKLRSTAIAEPVFVLGYGRSGTTHLHNLLWCDPQFGVVTNYQASLHPIALLGRGFLPVLFAGQLPKTRPMDNVAVSLDGPQEEEMAMVNATHHAPLHFLSFPNALPDLYDRYVAELGRDPAAAEGWKRGYREVLAKATLLSGGRRLALKTPPNMARIPTLLEMFPDARFVHIVRNPYPVYQSMRNMYRKVIPRQTLQELDWEAIDAWTLAAYTRQMTRYLEDRKRIVDGRLLEVRYEELDARPLEVLADVYRTLELGDFAAVKPRFEAYLAGLGSFDKNRFEFPPDVVGAVNAHWRFAFDAFGYRLLEPGEAVDA